MNKECEQYLSILAAIAVYYLVHEGVHLVIALYYGTFKQINFMGLGMQIDVYAERMSDTQLGLLCLTGPLATLLVGWILIGLTKRICSVKSKLFKAIMWYVSLAILLLDPLYLSVLCGFFGGGDMNGFGCSFRKLRQGLCLRCSVFCTGLLSGSICFGHIQGLFRLKHE